jgi:GTPase
MIHLPDIRKMVTIVGRPNVGKSTLFNKIIKQRKSLVQNEPGVTRNRLIMPVELYEESFWLSDTGGFDYTATDNITKGLVDQAKQGILEAHIVLLVVDGVWGMHDLDKEIARLVRKQKKKVVLCINKSDDRKFSIEEFYHLGVHPMVEISAEHNHGLGELMDIICTEFKEAFPQTVDSVTEIMDSIVEPVDSPEIMEITEDNTIADNTITDTYTPAIASTYERPTHCRLAIMGRPNVGKSSLLNRFVGKEFSLVHNAPNTTRDVVDAWLPYKGQMIQILDTAGIRKKGRQDTLLEYLSSIKAKDVVKQASCIVVVIDAEVGITEGDARVAGIAYESRKPILVVVNKWDLVLHKTTNTAKKFQENAIMSFPLFTHFPFLFTSALENQRVSKILDTCLQLWEKSSIRMTTGKLNRIFDEILTEHTPPLLPNKKRRIRFYYLTQISTQPPTFVLFTSDPDKIHFSYSRYIENKIREKCNFGSIGIRLIFRSPHGKADE